MTRYLGLLGALVLLLALAGAQGVAAAPALPGQPVPPDQPDRGLVLVAVTSSVDLGRLEAASLPVYARFDGAAGAYALVAGGSHELTALAEAGLRGRLLDADTTGATYYLAYPAPGRGQPQWTAFGRPLFVDERLAILRITPAAAERLAETGVEIAQVSLLPKPLRTTATTAFPPVTTPDLIVRSMIDQVDAETLYQYTGDLSGEWPTTIGGAAYTITTRHTYSGTPIQKATQYVGNHLADLGLAVEYHTWNSLRPPNVIGELPGETAPSDIYMITGHLDDMPASGLAPGADDNASGSVGVLVAADILSQYRWSCTLRFALWTGEEQGLLGSAQYAARASSGNENILGVLNLDMIAWNTTNSAPDIDVHAKSTLPATVELANQFTSVISAYDLNLAPQVISTGTGSSDHASFWNYGYTAILGIEDYYPSYHDFNPYYHTGNDRLQYLDMGYYTEFVKAAVGSLAHMSGCLRTGTLQGDVTAAHNGSAIRGATLTMSDAHALGYTAATDFNGHYNRTLPAAIYAITAAAYGYLPATVAGVSLNPGATVTQNFVLTAAPPTAPAITLGVKGGEALLMWLHVAPDTAYQVHRATNPYFTPGSDTLIATLNMPVADQVVYPDSSSGVGDPAINHFYTVLGLNPAGQGAASNRAGEFDFALVAGG